ncbi:type IV pilus biogenesis/stability protein PilW [Marinobacter sp.]
MVAGALLMGLLVGCVTTTDSRFSREADENEALQNYIQLATAYVAQENYERARVHLERALEIEPNSAPAHAVKGLIMQREGEEELADSSFRKALSIDPGYTRGRVYYAAFLYGEGQYERARDEFARAAADTSYPDRASVFYNLGRTEQRLGNSEAAADAFKRAVELGRGDARALLALSSTLVEAGKYGEAAYYYDRLMGLMARSKQISHSPESLWTGIRIARFQGDQNRESSLALLLRNQYPNSDQYQKYKALMSDDK